MWKQKMENGLSAVCCQPVWTQRTAFLKSLPAANQTSRRGFDTTADVKRSTNLQVNRPNCADKACHEFPFIGKIVYAYFSQ